MICYHRLCASPLPHYYTYIVPYYIVVVLLVRGRPHPPSRQRWRAHTYLASYSYSYSYSWNQLKVSGRWLYLCGVQGAVLPELHGYPYTVLQVVPVAWCDMKSTNRYLLVVYSSTGYRRLHSPVKLNPLALTALPR